MSKQIDAPVFALLDVAPFSFVFIKVFTFRYLSTYYVNDFNTLHLRNEIFPADDRYFLRCLSIPILFLFFFNLYRLLKNSNDFILIDKHRSCDKIPWNRC